MVKHEKDVSRVSELRKTGNVMGSKFHPQQAQVIILAYMERRALDRGRTGFSPEQDTAGRTARKAILHQTNNPALRARAPSTSGPWFLWTKFKRGRANTAASGILMALAKTPTPPEQASYRCHPRNSRRGSQPMTTACSLSFTYTYTPHPLHATLILT